MKFSSDLSEEERRQQMQTARQRLQEQHQQDSHEYLQSRVQKQRTASVKVAQELARQRDAVKQEQDRHAVEEAAARWVAQGTA